MFNVLLCLAFLLVGTSFARAESSFNVKPPSNWKRVLSNSQVEIYAPAKSQDTVVLRVFDASVSMQKRMLAYENNLPALLQARNRALKLFGVGNFWINEIKTLKRKPGVQYDGIQIDGRLTSRASDRRVIERQYFIGNKVFQVVYTTLATKPHAPSELERPFDYFSPRAPARLPASDGELVGARTVTPATAPPQSLEDAALWGAAVPRPSDAMCASVPADKRWSPNDPPMSLARIAELAGSCLDGVGKFFEESITSLADLGKAAWNYATDTEYYEQTNSTVSLVWNKFYEDPKAFSVQLLTTIANIVAKKNTEFSCWKAIDQIHAVCKAIPAIATAGLAIKAIIGKLTGAELDAIALATEKAMKDGKENLAAKYVAANSNDASKMIKIPEAHRPEHIIPDSGKPVGTNEIISGGHMPRTRAEVQNYINSPDFRDGTYVMSVVRDEHGVDHLMFENRIPDQADALNGKINTHRTLRQKYRDEHGGKDPQIVGGGECIVNMAGALVSCINRMGTNPIGNTSPEYLLDAAEAAGFKRTPTTVAKTFDEAKGDVEAGHVDAAISVLHEQEMIRHHPGFLPAFRDYARQVYTKHSGVDPSGLDMDWVVNKASKVVGKSNPDISADKKKAYGIILRMTSYMREGANDTSRNFMATNNLRDADIPLVEKYLPEFLKDVDAQP